MKRTVIACLVTGILAAVVAFLASVAILGAAPTPTLRILHTWVQPEGLDYDGDGDAADGPRYYLHLVEGSLDLGNFPFTVKRRTFLYAGRDAERVSYGHMKPYSLEETFSTIDDYCGECSVVWTVAGIELTEPSGHRLFIPADRFAGGR